MLMVKVRTLVVMTSEKKVNIKHNYSIPKLLALDKPPWHIL